jgi:hypothetical protein
MAGLGDLSEIGLLTTFMSGDNVLGGRHDPIQGNCKNPSRDQAEG